MADVRKNHWDVPAPELPPVFVDNRPKWRPRLFAFLFVLFFASILYFVSTVRPAAPPVRYVARFDSGFVVYPRDTNHMGTLFGGKTAEEMDRAAGIAVRRALYGTKYKRAVTASTALTYTRPGNVGDLVLVSAVVTEQAGRKLTVSVTVQRESSDGKTLTALAYGQFLFVALE